MRLAFVAVIVTALTALAMTAPQAALVPSAKKVVVLGKGKTNPPSSPSCSGAVDFGDGCAIAIFGH